MSEAGIYWLYMFTEVPKMVTGCTRLEEGNRVVMAFCSSRNDLDVSDAYSEIAIAKIFRIQNSFIRLVTFIPIIRSYIAGFRLDNLFDPFTVFSIGCDIDSSNYLLHNNRMPFNIVTLNKGQSWNVSLNSLQVRNEGIYYFSLTIYGPHGVVMYKNEKHIYAIQPTSTEEPQSISLIQKFIVSDSVHFTAIKNSASKVQLKFNGFLYNPKRERPKVVWLITIDYSADIKDIRVVCKTVINEGSTWRENRNLLVGETGYYYIHINVVYKMPNNNEIEHIVYIYSDSKFDRKTLLYVHTDRKTLHPSVFY